MSTKQKKIEASPVEIARQIADKAAGEIADLDKTLVSIQENDVLLRQEREQIIHEQALRDDHLLDLRNNVARWEQQHKEAVNYASVAQGTMGEQEAYRQVKEHLSMLTLARSDVESVAGPYSDQGQAATARLAEIEAKLQGMAQQAREAHVRRADVARVRDRAVNELGEHTYQGLLATYQTHQAKIEALRQQIVELQVAKIQFLDQAQETLASWPALARKFRNEEPYEDPTARILAAARDYVERLVEDGPQIAYALDVPATRYAQGNNWLMLLEVPRHDLFINEHVSSGRKHQGLTQRLHILDELLSQYVASKR